MRIRRTTIRLLLALLSVTATGSPAMAANGLVNGVPDWHQPCLIGGGNGPNNGANPGAGQAKYIAWCVPSAASDIMGWWRDQQGFNGIADAQIYANGGTIPWNPPNPTDWQDDGADASSIPTQGGGARAAGLDLGWYLNTNDQGDQSLANAGGAGGETFTGTKRADIQAGLTNYLSAAGYGGAEVSYSPQNHAQGWMTITAEINAGRPLIGHFSHESFTETAPGSDEWEWGTNPGEDDQTGADWGDSGPNGLGHAMAIVGYYSAGDPLNPWGGGASTFDVIVVQDNRRHLIGGIPEVDNNFKQHALKYFDVQNQLPVAPFVGTTTVQVPEPGAVVLLVLGVVCLMARRCRKA